MRKRGQVTIFIIIGILILGIVLGMVYLSKYLAKGRLGVEEEEAKESVLMASSVKMFVEGCLEKTAEDSLLLIGQQGGHYKLNQSNVLFTEFIPTFSYINETEGELVFVRDTIYYMPYYYYLGGQFVPDEAFVRNELIQYVEDNFLECINNFEYFKARGFQITEGEVIINVQLRDKKVYFELKYPISVLYGQSTKNFEHFEFYYNLELKKILQIVQDAADRQEQAGNAAIIGDIASLALLYDFQYDIDYLDNENVLYLFHFEPDDYIFAYAARYDWADELAIDDPYLFSEPEEFEEAGEET